MDVYSTLTPIKIDPGQDHSYFYHIRPLFDVPALMADSGLRQGKCLIVSDQSVGTLYGRQLENVLASKGWDPKRIDLPAGEPSKSYACLHDIYDTALSWGIDRRTPVIALGGGVVGDLAGFAAATLLRGLPLVQLPTTLIAQVDSALGGKTGINHEAGKNLIGSFHQPAFVCADLDSLTTLPQREWTSGLAEVVKHALIADTTFLDFLELNWPSILLRNPAVIGQMVHKAAAIKAAVVSEDVKEAGIRAILNFGHTFGHAIERIAGYGHFTHGEAVAVGMRMALRLSKHLHPALDIERCDAIVKQIPLYHSLTHLSVNDLIESMYADKKTLAGSLRFILLDRVGHAYVEINADTAQVRTAIDDIIHVLDHS
ncbi:MAG: 3-dehydroquinate synthase [Rhodothermaceae bacterium]|nr:3-dehydroquinate synthase [Rhodothermaceae bacterium]